MANYKVIVISRHENVGCEYRRFQTKHDAEQALEVDIEWMPDLIAEVSEIRDGDMSVREEQPISFDEWDEEEK